MYRNWEFKLKNHVSINREKPIIYFDSIQFGKEQLYINFIKETFESLKYEVTVHKDVIKNIGTLIYFNEQNDEEIARLK